MNCSLAGPHWLCLVLASVVVPFLLLAQTKEPPSLRLSGLTPSGVRASVTESWSAFDFAVTNLTTVDRKARVLAQYAGQPDVQFGREVWVPAQATLSSWLLIGPAPPGQSTNSRELEFHLYDVTEGQEKRLTIEGELMVRSRALFYQQREPTTAVLLDSLPEPPEVFGRLPQPEPVNETVLRLVRTFRLSATLSERVQEIRAGSLPRSPQGFEGIDHVVLAGRLERGTAGTLALRHWLQQGGKIWVLLDQVDAETLGILLGDQLDFQVVDRVGLTSFTIKERTISQINTLDPQKHEQPVSLVRVLLPATEQARYTVNGWPVWFTRSVGRGQVYLSTLGPAGWSRPRGRTERPAPFPNHPNLPVANEALQDLAVHLQPPRDRVPVSMEQLWKPLLTEEIGYRILGRNTVALIFALFLLTASLLAFLLHRSHRPELAGWSIPLAAGLVAGLFFLLKEQTGQSAMPTLALAQVVEASTGKEEVSIQGLLALYQPTSGLVDLGAKNGGFFDLDMTALEGRTRRLMLDDLDGWRWENLALPASVRFAPFRTTLATEQPVVAQLRCGPLGLEGSLQAGPFANLSDAILVPAEGRPLSAPLSRDGTFRAESQNILPANQFLPEAVLSDRQQRRQELYRHLLRQPGWKDRKQNVILAWADPVDPRFTADPDRRIVGEALLIFPVQLQPATPRTRITLPGSWIRYQRIIESGPVPPILDSDQAVDMHLRFQLPCEVLPFTLDRARIALKIHAPGRRVTLSTRADRDIVPVRVLESPLDPVLVEITGRRQLPLDANGGFHLQLQISAPPRAGGKPNTLTSDERWKIDYLEVEVSGQVEDRPTTTQEKQP